jgi:malate/lactate dehydrogenase
MSDWWRGTSNWASMGVISDGNTYGAPQGVIFSFPCIVEKATKQWKIIDDVPLDDVAKQKLLITGQELVAEREEALAATSNA